MWTMKRAVVVGMLSLWIGCAGASGEGAGEEGPGETGSSETGEETGSGSGPGDPASPAIPCEESDCEGANPCTSEDCIDDVCTHSVTIGAPCDDGNACTQADFCNAGGLCAGGAAVPCDDGNPCTTTPCDAIDGCQTFVAATGSPCDDGDACTVGDACGTLGCVGGPVECPAGQGCQQAVGCDSNTGECLYDLSPNGASCDDGDWCTTQDACTGGECAGAPLIDCMFLQAPDPGSCYEGVLGEEVKQRALLHLNELRAIHGIPSVVYDHSGDVQTQRSAFMMSVNSDIDHFPSESWACYSWEGAEGCSSSNLFMRWGFDCDNAVGPEDDIDGWLNDEGVPSLGHRRWLIDPFLQKVSYGSAYGAPLVPASYPWAQGSTLQVIHEEKNDPSGMANDFVAFPQGEYPAEAFEIGWYLSFGAVISKSNKWENSSVSYADAGVLVKDPGGASLPVHSVNWNTENFGLPNMLQWRVDGLQHSVAYTVEITNVETSLGWKNYSYTFRVN